MRITKSLQKWTISLALIMAIGIMDAFRYSSISPNSKILHINLEQIAKSSVSIKLSEIASEISYVPLETTKDCFFTPSQYLVRGNYIYAKDRDNGKVLLFNGEGKFIRQIGNIGKGPLEHMGAFNIHATPTGDRVYLYSKSSNRLSEYSFEGKKISDCSAKYASWWFAPLGNDQNIFLAPFGYPVPDSSAFFYYLQDNKGKVTKKYKSSTNIPIGGVIEFGNFYVNPRSILTFQPLCDTVFAISDKGDFTPEYVFDFGNGRMPDEVWRETPKYEKVKYDYINYINLVETKNTLFVRFI